MSAQKPLPWRVWLLMLWPYAALAANVLLIRISLAAWLGGLAVTLLVTGLSIRCALAQKEGLSAARWSWLIKLVHIPAYALALVACVVLWMAPPLVLMILATNCCMLLASSAYSLRAVFLAWRAGHWTGGKALLPAASQCLFVLDVLGSLIIYVNEKRRSC